MKDVLNLVIVEDDPLIAFDIKELLTEEGHQISGVYHTAEEAINNFPEDVDIALLDINLGDGISGIELGKYLNDKKEVPCIFITSYYDEKTVEKARNANPLAYILKPYEERDIIINIELCKSKLKKKVKPSQTAPIFVKNGAKLSRIIPDEIDYAQANDMYSNLYVNGRRISTSQTLKQVEAYLTAFNFIRVHRSFLVNLFAIEGIHEDDILIGDKRIPVGRTYKKELFKRITTI